MDEESSRVVWLCGVRQVRVMLVRSVPHQQAPRRKDQIMKPFASYTVTYRGGLPGLPKAKPGGINLAVWSDRFELTGKVGSKFWSDLVIPYTSVSDVTIADRQVDTFEALAGGLDSRQLNQRNNIHITFTDERGVTLVLRLEMLTGFVVPAQAKRCAELQDLLRVNNIRAQFSA